MSTGRLHDISEDGDDFKSRKDDRGTRGAASLHSDENYLLRETIFKLLCEDCMAAHRFCR